MSTTAKSSSYSASYRSSGVSGLGINEQGAEKIVTAIDNYKKAINTCIRMFGVSTSVLKQGIQGTSAQAQFNALISQIKSKQASHLSILDQYVELLNSVKSSYKKNDEDGTIFKNATESFK